MADGLLPPVVAVLALNAAEFKAGIAESGAAMKTLQDDGASTSSKMAAIGSAFIAVGAAAGAVSGVAVKMAADFETATNRLVTSAGESKDSIDQVRTGIMDMAGQVGFTDQQLAQAMYTVDSAGFHAADSLTILKAAAQGAKIEQADLGTTVDAVTTSLVDYHLGADQASTVMSKLVAAVGEGKTTLQELAGSLHSVTPLAANLGISFDEVTAAVATMTVHGMSADQATQNLADTLRHLSNPTQTMIAEMGQLGLSSQKLSQQLADPSVGLHGVLDEIYTDIMSKMGPGGEVLLGTFKQSASAAGDLQQMLSGMPAQLKTLATELMNNQISFTAFKKDVNNLPEDLSNLGKQFETLFNNANGFSDALKSGSPAAQTFEAALAKIMGDSTGLNTALMLGGENAQRFADNINTVSQATPDASGNVKNWGDVQNTLNQKLADTEGSLSTLAVKVGNDLLPSVKNAADALNGFVGWLDKSQVASDLLAGSLKTLTVVGFGALALKLGGMVGSVLGFTGAMSGLAGIGFTGIALGIGAIITKISDLETANDSMKADGGLVVATPESINNMQSATDKIQGFFKSIGDAAVNAWNIMRGTTTKFQDAMNDFDSSVGDTFGNKLADAMKNGIPKTQAAAQSVASAIVQTFKDQNFQVNGTTTMDDFSSGMRDAVGAAIDAAASVTGSIKTAFELFDPSPEGKATAEKFGDGIKTGRQAVDAAGQEGLNALLTILGSGGGLAQNAGRLTTSSFANGVLIPLPQVSSSAGQLMGNITGPLSNLPSSAFFSGNAIGNNLAAGIRAAIPTVASASTSMAEVVRNHLPSSPAKVGPLSGSGSPELLGRNISNMIAAGIASGRPLVGNAMAGVLQFGGAGGPSFSSGGSFVSGGGSSLLQTVQIQLDGKTIAQQTQKITLRSERNNVNNGLTRYVAR